MASLMEQIEAANKKWMDLFSKGDHQAIGGLYTENCSVMPTGMDVVKGRQGAGDVFAGAMKSGVKNVLLKTDEVGPMGAGDTVYERGHYTFYGADGAVVDEGKYVVIWKKMDGTWWLDIDIWNSNK